MALIALSSILRIGVSRALGIMVVFGDASTAIRNEFALSQSHQAQVTKDRQHNNACCEKNIRTVYDTAKSQKRAPTQSKKGPRAEQANKKGCTDQMETRWAWRRDGYSMGRT